MNSKLRALLSPAAGNQAAEIANVLLRVSFGLLVFVIHGLHKAKEGFHHLSNLSDWPLAHEIREMGVPAPVAQAVVATVIQLIAPLCIIVGFGTRPAAAALAAVLAGAVAQNLQAGRDPQLALLYLIVASTLAIWGAGRHSIDTLLKEKVEHGL